ncbi:uncharacterized protein DNG_04155 [Cephalotrichum gorgonifer]|uniref:Uncharacterized protein n=1 Tax=Cephalotrichum gorgonifer TaxID=2041049 RepID=A0AAE8SU95_9PEZI|nr:uncharacterized protein DNG_04155 [Cephalotrichum gorgonifer]
MFGGGAASKPATSLFGGGATTTQQQQGGGLFGTAQPAQQQQQSQPAGGGLFGGGAAQAAKPSLFGSTATAQPQQSGGLFGSTPAATTTQPQAQQSGGLFGGAQQQKPAGSGLFGGGASTTAGSSLFGQPQQQQTTQPQTASILGGQQQQAAQQAVPGVRVDLTQVKGSTKFDDLTKEGQELILGIEAAIEKVGKWKDEISGYTPMHEQDIRQLAVDVAYLENKYELVKRAVLEGDVASVQEMRTLSNKNIDDAQTVGRAVENLKLPAHYHLPGLWTSSGANTSFGGDPGETDLIGFFNRQCAQLHERDQKLRAYLAEIQQHMPNVEGGLYQKLTALQNQVGSSGGAFEEMRATLLDMRNAILSQAVEVGKAREALTKLQLQYLNPMLDDQTTATYDLLAITTPPKAAPHIGTPPCRGAVLEAVEEADEVGEAEAVPKYYVKPAGPISRRESREVQNFLLLRRQIHDGPLYTRRHGPYDPLHPRRIYDQAQRNSQYVSRSKANADLFNGVETFSSRFKASHRTLPDFSTRPYVKRLFPPELHDTLEGAAEGKKRKGGGEKKLKLSSVTALRTAEEVFRANGAQSEEALRKLEMGALGEEGAEEGADDDEAPEEDEDYAYDDEDAGDYDAEAYFDDGDEEGDDGDDGGDDGGVY